MVSDISFVNDIKKYDPENLHQDILQTPFMAEQGYGLVESIDLSNLKEQYNHVIVAGMGGSSIAALILKNYLQNDKLKLEIVQDYILPKWTDTKTLVIVSSYSGNTEETLSVFKEARRSNCGIVCVTVGGKLEEYAKVSRIPIVILPSGYQPRSAMTIQLFAILRVLEKLKLITSRSPEVNKLREELKPQLSALEQNAIALSEKLVGKIPLIHTSKKYSSIGYRWKCQFNENAKTQSYCSVFSELNHNEMDGYEIINGNYHMILLRFDDDHRRIQQRMTLTKELMLKKGIPSTDIAVRGQSSLGKIFSAIILGDFTSYYLAIRTKVNPSKVTIIEDFKRSLGPYVG